MNLWKVRCFSALCVVGFVICGLGVAQAGDIVHDDDSAPKRPGCENDFVLVKVQTWVNGVEDREFVGVGARFGKAIVSKEKNANQSRLTLSDPRDCCSTLKHNLTNEVIMVDRGKCTFTKKANIAEAAGASAVLIINNEKELYKMVCDPGETDLDIHIPTVMLPQDAGISLDEMLANKSSSISVQLYSPRRPVVDIAEVFLWLMAVGTILCASFWSAWSARDAAIEHEKLVEDASDEVLNAKDTHTGGVVEITTISAVLFIVVASCFLILLYKFMSAWFIELLVVLFCIGGVEGLQTCLVALLSRWFKRSAQSYVKVPVLGAISYLTLAVSPFCITFAVAWALYRNWSYAWIGQDILGIALIVTVLQIVRLPNLKVGTVLLGCAFLYDIFWVFVSKKLFHESVMIVVARGDGSGEEGIPMLLKIPRMFDPWGGHILIQFGSIEVRRVPPPEPISMSLSSSILSVPTYHHRPVTSLNIPLRKSPSQFPCLASSPSTDELIPQSDEPSSFPPGSCEGCGKAEKERGCNGEGRIQGGIATVPGFGWWPIKAYRPCPGFVESGGRYKRFGQSMDDVVSGRGRRRPVALESDDDDASSSSGKKSSPRKFTR